MAQVKDLQTQNLELQRSHQELSQAVASTAGISQSYGDRMTQILSTLAKFDAAVQGYRRDSKVMQATVADQVRRSHYHVFLGVLDPGYSPLFCLRKC